MKNGHLRVCVPQTDGLYVVNEQDGRVTGPLKEAITCLLDIYSGNFNRSLKIDSAVGVITNSSSMSYDGCLGKLQSNESDVLLALLTMPVEGPNLTTTIVDGSQRNAMMSGYKPATLQDKSIQAKTHVLDMFLALESGVWLMTALLVLLLFMIMRTRLRMTKEYKKNPWLALEALVVTFLKQLSSTNQPELPALTVAFTSLVQLMFYVGYFLTSMIKTDMVVIRPPLTIRTYEELLASGRRPAWLQLTSDMRVFQEASPDSLEGRVWQRATDMGMDQSIIRSGQHFREDVMKAGIAGSEMTLVLLSMEVYISLAIRLICFMSRVTSFNTHMTPLIAVDPDAVEQLLVSVRNPHLTSSIATQIRQRRQWIFEANLLMKSFDIFDTKLFSNNIIMQTSDHHAEVVAECCRNMVEIPSHDLIAVPLHHYMSLLIACLICLLLATLVYRIEQRISLYKRARERRRRGLRLRARPATAQQ